MKRTMLLAAYDAVESLASLSSRVESRFRSDKKRTLKSAPVVGHNGFRYRVHSDWGIPYCITKIVHYNAKNKLFYMA